MPSCTRRLPSSLAPGLRHLGSERRQGRCSRGRPWILGKPCGIDGYWPSRRGMGRYSSFEGWTSNNLGWSFPCSEAVGLVRRYFDSSSGRVIDVGAGFGLWTKVLRRTFCSERVIGLDPTPKGEGIIEASFENWCERTEGPREDDLILASWLPCSGQTGSDLGPQILDRIQSGQPFVYIGSGPHGPTGTKEFYDRLGREFVEYAAEPMPRIYPGVFPRDFARVYFRKT